MLKLGKWVASLLPLPSCVLCHQVSEQVLCPTCAADIETFNVKQCHGNLMLIPKIKRALNNSHIDHLAAIGVYQWPLDKLISRLKFDRKLCHGRALAELFAEQWGDVISLPEALVPVPLHFRRFMSRRFNQSAELADHLSDRLSVAVDGALCRRIRATPNQRDLGAAARRRNLRNAFVSRSSGYRHIAIVDDVVTTGSTVEAMYQSIVRNNPGCRVDVWAMAIALPKA